MRTPVYKIWKQFEIAAYHDDFDALLHLIETTRECGEPLTAMTDAGGETPLHVAAFLGQAGMAEILIREGAEINCRCKAGNTPLHAAMDAEQSKRREIVALLLEHGADPNIRNNLGETPLFQNPDMQTVDLLLAGGSNPGVVATDGDTALHHAGDSETAHRLVEAGVLVCAVTWRGLTPLHTAARHANAAVCQTLIAAGADKEARDDRGMTPLAWAAYYANESPINVLQSAGADINACDNEGRCVISLAGISVGEDKEAEDCVRCLIAAGADPRVPDVKGNNASALAALKGRTAIAALLKDRIHELDLRDRMAAQSKVRSDRRRESAL